MARFSTLLISAAVVAACIVGGAARSQTIPQLPAATSGNASDLLACYQTNITRKCTALQETSGAASSHDVRLYGAVCDGVTDDSSAINSAITSAAAAGTPTTVVIPRGLNCAISNTVTLKSDVIILDLGTITWTGGLTGPMFMTSTSAPTNRTGVIGSVTARGKIAPGTTLTGDIFNISGGWSDRFEHLEIEGGTTSVTVFDLNDQQSSTPKNNLAFSNFEDITGPPTATVGGSGSYGTIIRLAGLSTGGGTYVTLNHFSNFRFNDVNAYGVNIVGYADTNEFYDLYFMMVATNSVGLYLNSGAPSSSNDIDQESFYSLIVDCPALGGVSSRSAVVVGESNANVIHGLIANSPSCENGAVNNSSNYDLTWDELNNATGLTTVHIGSNSRLAVGSVISDGAPLVSVGSCTGLGTGSCAKYFNPTDSGGVIQLSPTGSPSSSGVVEMAFTQGQTTARVCHFTALNGTGTWTAGMNFSYSGVDATHINVNWTNGGSTSLSAGSVYDIAYQCQYY